jgi:hypothetical protein
MSLVDSIAAASEPGRDPVDMAMTGANLGL